MDKSVYLKAHLKHPATYIAAEGDDDDDEVDILQQCTARNCNGLERCPKLTSMRYKDPFNIGYRALCSACYERTIRRLDEK